MCDVFTSKSQSFIRKNRKVCAFSIMCALHHSINHQITFTYFVKKPVDNHKRKHLCRLKPFEIIFQSICHIPWQVAIIDSQYGREDLTLIKSQQYPHCNQICIVLLYDIHLNQLDILNTMNIIHVLYVTNSYSFGGQGQNVFRHELLKNFLILFYL